MLVERPDQGRAVTRCALRALVLGVIATAIAVAIAPPAHAAPTCTGSIAANSTYTCLPNGSGSVQVTVPAHVEKITIVADGGGGGRSAGLGNGGSGARVTSPEITVTPGAVLRIYVGAGGGAGVGGAGNVGGTGYGTGGNGGAFYGEGFGGGYGGGGGGSSAVLIGGTVQVVAGGGGGGGSLYGGSASAAVGSSGGSSGDACARGGGGGNAAGAGSAGTTSGTGNATPGSTSDYAGKGGTGIYGAGGASSGGGGGGGGYGGGGGGNWNGPYGCSQAGGGGAGGSYGPAGTVFGSAGNAGGVATAGAGGDGQVQIIFTRAPTVPGSPTGLVFNTIGPDSITAHWTAPEDDGGAAISGYDVSIDSGPPTRVPETTRTFTGLSSGTTYTVSVTAVNSQGSSPALVASQATAASPPPYQASNPATDLTFPDVSGSTITLAWSPPAVAITGWPTLSYQVRIDGGLLTSWRAPTYTATGFAPGTSHSFEIYVINGITQSVALTGSASTLTTVPDAPADLVFDSADSTTIAAHWTAPANTGGTPITAYTISVDGGAGVETTGTSYTASGLRPSSWHTFSVVAVNAQGPSASDLWGAASTAAAPAMTATSVAVGSPSTVSLTGFAADSTQTVQVTAPDSSTSTFTITVDATGAGSGTYIPSQPGTYRLTTAPWTTSAAFTATATPTSAGDAPSGSSSTTAPRAAPSITITGRAGTGRRAGRIHVRGTTQGLAGTRVIAHVRLTGQSRYVTRGEVRVDARGRFSWTFASRRPASIFFTGADGARSNRVVITARRPRR